MLVGSVGAAASSHISGPRGCPSVDPAPTPDARVLPPPTGYTSQETGVRPTRCRKRGAERGSRVSPRSESIPWNGEKATHTRRGFSSTSVLEALLRAVVDEPWGLGAPWWCSRLRIPCCHCSSSGCCIAWFDPWPAKKEAWNLSSPSPHRRRRPLSPHGGR